MQIRLVDVHDDAEFHAFHCLEEAAQRHGRPYATFPSETEAAVVFRVPDRHYQVEPYAAFDGEEMVGAAHLEVPLHDNLDKVYFTVEVAPEQRRRGIGTALVDHVVTRARELGREVLIGDAHFPSDAGEDHPYRRFATKHGFALANAETHRVLELPVAEEDITAWIEESSPHHEDYTIETFVDGLPEDLQPSYVHLINQLAVDAPTGDIDFEEEGLTVEGFRARQEKLKAQGRMVFSTVAIVDTGDGREAVAHSVLACPREGADEPNMYQWATLVRRDHRGHHLGLALKARNLREAQRARPERRFVHTSNSDVNGPMVAINERIGFRPVEVNAEYLRRLP